MVLENAGHCAPVAEKKEPVQPSIVVLLRVVATNMFPYFREKTIVPQHREQVSTTLYHYHSERE